MTFMKRYRSIQGAKTSCGRGLISMVIMSVMPKWVSSTGFMATEISPRYRRGKISLQLGFEILPPIAAILSAEDDNGMWKSVVN